jgi:hypothetical protein
LFLYSVSRGNHFEIIELGISGGELVDDYPELAIAILNTLEKCFKILKDENLLSLIAMIFEDKINQDHTPMDDMSHESRY